MMGYELSTWFNTETQFVLLPFICCFKGKKTSIYSHSIRFENKSSTYNVEKKGICVPLADYLGAVFNKLPK